MRTLLPAVPSYYEVCIREEVYQPVADFASTGMDAETYRLCRSELRSSPQLKLLFDSVWDEVYTNL